ncbi:hypothetical protein APR12_005493 [Nocardia amikacinitolerans]|nr:hypothetical protein [Nocardia amikacinitolerans]
MKPRSGSAAAIAVVGTLTLAAGAAHAEPDVVVRPDIVYSTKLVDHTVVATVKHGTFTVTKAHRDEVASGARLTEINGTAIDETGKPVSATDVVDVVDLADDSGHTVLTLPLAFTVAGVDVPVEGVVEKDGTVLTLAPRQPSALEVSRPLIVKPIASQAENQHAMNEFSTQFGMATSIGAFLGTAVGAAIGCVVTLVAGCVTGLVTGASVGGILGTVAAGGPTLVASGIDLLTTLNAEEGTTRWADKPKADQPKAGQP